LQRQQLSRQQKGYIMPVNTIKPAAPRSNVISPARFITVRKALTPTVTNVDRAQYIAGFKGLTGGPPGRTARILGNSNLNSGIVGPNYIPFGTAPVSDSNIELPGQLPEHKKARLSGWGEPFSLMAHVDTDKIQKAIRAAERGNTTLLFTYYRDFMLGGSHISTEMGKRKVAVIGQPHKITAWKARGQRNATLEDQRAADSIAYMIDDLKRNWFDGLLHLMDASMWPVAVHEKIVGPASDSKQLSALCPNLRYRIKRLDPVSPFIFSYQIAYLASGGFQFSNGPQNDSVSFSAAAPLQFGRQPDVVWDPDSWEPDLRFYTTLGNGMINYNFYTAYAPDPMRHIVHRGNMLSRDIRDNYGGVWRAVIFWNFIAQLAKDWFSRSMNKYGHPVLVVEADQQNVDTFNFLQEAIKSWSDVCGIVLNQDAKAQLMSVNSSGIAEGYKLLIDTCHGEISKVICGHEGSSTAKAEGLNSQQEQMVENVRQDIRLFDQVMLKSTLEEQVFRWYMDINGIPGHTPGITWGGLSEEDATELLTQIEAAKNGNLELTDEGIVHINQVTGMEYQRLGMSGVSAQPGASLKPGDPPIPTEEDAVPAEKLPDDE
jgi:Protein of unknown function (DUF935)